MYSDKNEFWQGRPADFSADHRTLESYTHTPTQDNISWFMKQKKGHMIMLGCSWTEYKSTKSTWKIK